MAESEVYADTVEDTDLGMTFTQLGIAVSFVWMLMPQALRLAQLV